MNIARDRLESDFPHIYSETRSMRLVTTLLLLFAFLTGCAYEGGAKLPGVYRIDIQQGNIVDQEMISKLQPGMVESQVQYIMGTPVLIDPFHKNRWEYIYTFSEGGKQREQRRITLYFDEGKLAYIDGDVVTGLGKPPEEFKQVSKTVDVPLEKHKSGFLDKVAEILPFVGDDDPRKPKNQGTQDAEPLPPGIE